ncbi:hypothetical protein NQ318_008536 [Aromia moschata]|uniref:Uncharacterized protein n=1 Tax=Aromia moschata TaxID=1265417 RepID=A0AAV8YY66_9CUCU|nr:hypothetical protein NQ318_008536 [Aromia moschata]
MESDEEIESAEEEQRLHHDACQANPATYADHDLLHDLAANLDNPQVGAYMLCESKGVGLQKPNGQLDIDTIRSKISLTVTDTAKVDKLIKECAIPKNSPEKTAIHLFSVLRQGTVSPTSTNSKV